MNIKPSKQKWLPLEYQGDVFVSGYEIERPVEDERLMERENVMSALRRVESNRGSAGVDGMPVSQLRTKRSRATGRAVPLSQLYR